MASVNLNFDFKVSSLLKSNAYLDDEAGVVGGVFARHGLDRGLGDDACITFFG